MQWELFWLNDTEYICTWSSLSNYSKTMCCEHLDLKPVKKNKDYILIIFVLQSIRIN